MSEKRRKANALGVEAESQAAEFLRTQGWDIEAMRFKTKAGEVDLIARKDALVIFVEVKARKQQINALESVTPKSKARIRTAAQEWLAAQEDGQMVSWRIDLIAIVPNAEPVWVEGAF